MKSLCDALILALRHIDSDAAGDEDADVALQEEVASALQSATPAEISALRVAAKKHGVPALLEDYGVDDL